MQTEPHKVTCAVTIGRNATHEGVTSPMRERRWKIFLDETLADIQEHGAQLLQAPVDGNDQLGAWDNQTEWAACFVFILPSLKTESLKKALRGLAKRFGQDAIGLIIHADTDTLIYAEEKDNA